MLTLSPPGILGMAMVALNSLIDAFFVSHLISSYAFAGVSLTLPLSTVNSALTSMLSSGASVLYSRSIGSENEGLKPRLFKHLLLLVSVSSFILALLGTFFAEHFLQFLGAQGKSLEYGSSFYKLSVIGYITSMLGLCTSGLIRAEGNISYAMKITGIAVVLNILLNPVLIKYTHLGIQGSALATILSMAVYSALNIRYFLKEKGLMPKLGRSTLDLHFAVEILRTGLPSFFMQINGFIRQFVLFRLVAMSSVGLPALATFSAIYRLFSFAALPVLGILQAYAPIIGINWGAGQTERVKKAIGVFRLGACLLMTCMALPGLLFPETMLETLVSPDKLLPNGALSFRLVLLILPILPLASTSIVFLQATGHSNTASRLTLGREFLLFLPILLLSVKLWNYQGIYYGLLLENAVYILIVYTVALRTMKRAFQGHLSTS